MHRKFGGKFGYGVIEIGLCEQTHTHTLVTIPHALPGASNHGIYQTNMKFDYL